MVARNRYLASATNVGPKSRIRDPCLHVFERPPVAFGLNVMLFSLAAEVDLYQSGAYEALRAARSTKNILLVVGISTANSGDTDITEQENMIRSSFLHFCLQ